MSFSRRFGLIAAFAAVCVMAFGLSVGRLELTPTDDQSIGKDTTESKAPANGPAASVAILLTHTPWSVELVAAGWLEDAVDLSPVESSLSVCSPRSPPQFLS